MDQALKKPLETDALATAGAGRTPRSKQTWICWAIAGVVGSGIVGCGGGDDGVTDVSSGTVIRNVTVVNTQDGSLTPGMAVVVEQGKIQNVLPNGRVRSGGSAQDVDATGKYVVPGYNDMHTHVFNASAADRPLIQKLLVAHGVTGVREMGGSPEFIQLAKQVNASRDSGMLDVPEILMVPGRIVGLPPLPGVAHTAAPAAAAATAEGAAQEVRDQKGYGAGFIKAIGGTRDATLALLAEAGRQGTHVAGHFPTSVSAREASDAGWHAVEHLGAGLTMLLECSASEDTLRASLVAGTPAAQLRQPILDTYDDGKCQALAQTFARNNTWHVPTLIRLRTQLVANDPLYVNDPNLAWVSPATRAQWSAAVTAFSQANTPASAALLRRYFDRQQVLPGLMKRNGVKLLAGSDMSINPVLTANGVIPGISLHQEFALLAAGGLTPLEVLQATTLNTAEFLGRQATMGTVAQGRNADLVLLDANPLANAAHLAAISGVVLRGKYFSKAALDKLTADVATAYAVQTPLSTQVQPPATHGHED